MASNVLQGTLDLLILRALAHAGALRGYECLSHIHLHSDKRIRVAPGSLYPALDRLEKHGFVLSQVEPDLHGVRARTYRITPSGERHLKLLRRRWTYISAGVDAILQA